MTIANERPRANAGTSGIGGKWMIDAHDISSSGSEGSSALHVRSTSAERSTSKNMAPAYSSSTGWTTNSIAVTTPKLPPPPRSAQNRFGWCWASARTRLPSAVTTSSAVTASACRPNLRDSQPMPPPSEYPAIPTSGDEPCRAASPCADSRSDDALPLRAGADADAPGARDRR